MIKEILCDIGFAVAVLAGAIIYACLMLVGGIYLGLLAAHYFQPF